MNRVLVQVFSSLALAGAASAQAEFVFSIAQSQSDFTWSGTSTLGAIVGNPSNQFEIGGTTRLELSPLGPDAIASGRFTDGGDAFATPDLHGKINNPFPFLPPLATIDVLGLHLKVGSPSFAIAGNGAFSADATITAISGTLVVTPLGGSPSQTALAGLMSTPQPQAGTVTQSGATLDLTIPIHSVFPFSDPGTGASGSITLTGTLLASWTCPPAQTYCTAKTNSLGCLPAIGSTGTASYTNPAPFVVSASNELNQKAGLLFYGVSASSAPFQGGFKCVASPSIRTGIQSSGGSASGDDCTGSYAYDFTPRIQGFVDPQLVPGAEIFVQYWSRDPQSPSTTNLTAGLRFTICP
jgi:hypothetical protein